jgi:hypothetical protein
MAKNPPPSAHGIQVELIVVPHKLYNNRMVLEWSPMHYDMHLSKTLIGWSHPI